MAHTHRLLRAPHEQHEPPVRPFGIGVIVAINVIMGTLSVLGGLNSLDTGWGPGAVGLGFLQFLAPVLPQAMVVIGALQLVLGYGLWRGLAWAWTLAVAFEVVHTVADIGFIADRTFAIDKFVGMVIILGSLAYLLRSSVRAYFRKGAVRTPRATVSARSESGGPVPIPSRFDADTQGTSRAGCSPVRSRR